MATARSEQIDLDSTQFYHCTTRCVRQAYICGKDSETGKDYSHRKEWLINRIQSLTEYFDVKICAYAIMDNHYHLVLFVDLDASKAWSNEEIQCRWGALFPRSAASLKNLHPQRINEIIAIWRERLTSISWFMRCLNENIALMANHEDKRKGRFWEGRFKSQALLDEGALLTAMAYVDLNPIRANMANTPEESQFTSIYERIKFAEVQLDKIDFPVASESHKKDVYERYDKLEQPITLMPFDNKTKNQLLATIDFSLSDYLELVDNTGRILRDDKPGFIPDKLLPILYRLNLSPEGWLIMTKELEEKFFYAVGHAQYINDFGQSYRCNKYPRGSTAAKQCYLDLVA